MPFELNRFDSTATPFAAMPRLAQLPHAALAPRVARWPFTWSRFKWPTPQKDSPRPGAQRVSGFAPASAVRFRLRASKLARSAALPRSSAHFRHNLWAAASCFF
eukprot:7662396-Pyramimonas_sp.AAC.1